MKNTPAQNPAGRDLAQPNQRLVASLPVRRTQTGGPEGPTPRREKRKAAKVSTSRAHTPLTPGERRSHPPKAESTRSESLTGQALERIRERQRLREISRPGDVRCKRCHQGFSPSWDHLERRWKYPGMAEDGICRRCKRLIHIREHIEQYLGKAGVPPKYLKCSFENFKVTGENRQSFGLCKGYVSSPNYNLFIYGNYGIGNYAKCLLGSCCSREGRWSSHRFPGSCSRSGDPFDQALK